MPEYVFFLKQCVKLQTLEKVFEDVCKKNKTFVCKMNLNSDCFFVQSEEISVFEDSVSHQLSRILHSNSQHVVLSSAALVFYLAYFVIKNNNCKFYKIREI